MLSRPDVCRYLLHPPLSVDEVVERVARTDGRTVLSADGDVIRLAIIRRDGGQMVGELVLIVASAEAACLEIGWVLHPDHQGQGFAAEGARALLGYAMAKLGAHRVVAQLHPDNTALGRLVYPARHAAGGPSPIRHLGEGCLGGHRDLRHPPLSVDEVVERVARFAGRTLLSEYGDVIRLAVIRRDSGQMRELVLILASAANACLEIGWVLHPDHQGQGFAVEGARALLGYAMATLGAHRVVAQLHPDNTGSAVLCTRLGMQQEAHHRLDVWVKGAWEDTAIFAILERLSARYNASRSPSRARVISVVILSTTLSRCIVSMASAISGSGFLRWISSFCRRAVLRPSKRSFTAANVS